MNYFPIVIFFTAVNFLNYLDRYLAAALMPLMSDELSLSHTQGGVLMSAFVVGYMIFAPCFGYLGDRWNRPKLMALGVIIWSLGTALSGFAGNFYTLLLARILVGAGEAGFVAIAPGFLKDRIPNVEKLNLSLSIFFSAIPAGSALGYVVGGALAHSFSWQLAFIFCAIPGLFAAIGLLLYRENRAQADAPPKLSAGILLIRDNPILRFAVIGYVVNNLALTSIASFIPKYGVTIGFDNQSINEAFGLILVITGCLGSIVGGKIATRYARGSANPLISHLRFIGIVSFIALPFLISAFMTENRMLFLIFCFVAELFVFATVTPVNAILVQAPPASVVTSVQGAAILCLNLGGSLPGPALTGLIADGVSLRFAMQCTALALAASGVIWWVGGRGRKEVLHA